MPATVHTAVLANSSADRHYRQRFPSSGWEGRTKSELAVLEQGLESSPSLCTGAAALLGATSNGSGQPWAANRRSLSPQSRKPLPLSTRPSRIYAHPGQGLSVHFVLCHSTQSSHRVKTRLGHNQRNVRAMCWTLKSRCLWLMAYLVGTNSFDPVSCGPVPPHWPRCSSYAAHLIIQTSHLFPSDKVKCWQSFLVLPLLSALKIAFLSKNDTWPVALLTCYTSQSRTGSVLEKMFVGHMKKNH